ncbi:importin subunit beta-1 [Anaeramoeba flamelloides]|uniref:Importin subunit beta-1 n=1 Tax=Anaeramoeba flamelloides TaxID=1746091 RepID=A0AAV7Z6K0_9EUKA|nr:importin subunit beta-1 [Anaeramoeba flamelloides]
MELTQILLDTQSNDAKKRIESEKQIELAKEKDHPLLLGLLAAELNEESNPLQSRQLAGLILKNTLVSKDEEKKKELADLWLNFNEKLRNEIKELLVLTLGSQQKIARNTSAQVIGAIAGVEFPCGVWSTVFEDLMQVLKIQKNNDNTKEGVFTCLGYVCNELENYSFEISNLNEFLLTIVDGMSEEETNLQIKYTATNALFNSLRFAHQIFENANDAKFLLDTLVSTSKVPDEKICQKVMECFVRIADLYYFSIGDQINDIYTV